MEGNALNGTRILVLEDEFLIAMDVEQLCREHGAAEVAIVRDVTDTEPGGVPLAAFDAAVIDVMVGGCSSLPFAGRLQEARVPFIFASGYPEVDDMFSGFPGVAVVGKPYAGGELIEALVRAMKGGRSG